MDNNRVIANQYAILIGIDAYPKTKGPLRSCVRDVKAIKKCLEGQRSSVDIQTFTASNSPELGIDTPPEDQEHWPTYRNVTLALETTTSRAQRGDYVYIHFSGHGTRRKPCFDYSNRSTGDLALVLLTGDQSPEELLSGPRLAFFLNAMVNKGLVITLVLDCCFSASVYRNSDRDLRYLPSELVEASEYSPNANDDPANINIRSANRDASMRDNWLLEPDRYAVLAACGPDEMAKGGGQMFEKGERYGALSFFLFNILLDYGLGRRLKDIYHHLRALFWKACVEQHPVRYGDEEQSFFGTPEPNHSAKSICIVECDKKFHLLAGQAQGLCDGDRLTIYPPGWKPGCSIERSCFAKITCAKPLTSNIEVLDTEGMVRTGWIAEPLTCSYLSNIYIRFAPGIQHCDEWLVALKERSIGAHANVSEVPALQVVPGTTHQYDILDDSGQRINNLPAIPWDQMDTNRICDMLEHLARFRMAKSLVNKTAAAAFRDSFHVQIVSGQDVFGPGKQIEARHDSVIEVMIENLGETGIYAHVYNLGPCWRVKSILHGTYEKIPPHDGDLNTAKCKKKIRMTIPPVMHQHGSCDDVIKVFITSQPTSFDLLELPNLDELARRSSNRISHPYSRESEDWVALNFPIRTTLNSNESIALG